MIEILLATYNGEQYVKEQLDSILNQTCQNFKILVRDDGSTDTTVDIIRDYIKNYPQKIELVQDVAVCKSPAKNFFQLVGYAEASYAMFADQDDFWLPEKLEVMQKKMQELEQKHGAETPILVFCDYKPVDGQLQELDFDSSNSQIAACHLELNRLLVQNYVTGCTVMVNRSLYTKLGAYDDAIEMHDWWTALHASALGVAYHLPEQLVLYRQHGSNCVGEVNIKSFKYRINKFLDKRTRTSQLRYLAQAKLLLERQKDALSEEKKQVLESFIRVWDSKYKITRVFRLLKGKFLKSDFVRILGQIWYV